MLITAATESITYDITRYTQTSEGVVIGWWSMYKQSGKTAEYIMGPCTKYHDNNVKALECTGIMIDGDFSYNGKYQSWYDNGNKRNACTYVNGKLDGVCEKWCENGTKYHSATYANSARNGVSYEWYWNGKARVVANYKDGKRHGEYRSWYPNGEQHIIADYVAGRRMELVIFSKKPVNLTTQ
jgi:antitoxin component YwqK of YwqJK toxin-antitoxin module